ncbi:MAG: hypothetical protein P1U53_17610 [Sulfitobacter sp.]|jgi:hypothetical protein|nr:hypothetical protein [Sulfitobacter sp.]
MITKRLLYRIWTYLEHHNAAIWFVVGFITAFLGHGVWFEWAHQYSWDRQTLFSAAFDFGGIYTAFLFAFYTYSISSGSEFFQQARSTKAFKNTITYVKRAIVLGFLMTLTSVPMMIWNPNLYLEFQLSNWAFCFWAAIVFGATAAFWRATRLFWIFARNAE